eukprot:2927358-Rhodomonas_salina.2
MPHIPTSATEQVWRSDELRRKSGSDRGFQVRKEGSGEVRAEAGRLCLLQRAPCRPTLQNFRWYQWTGV